MPAIRTFHHWPKSLDPQIHACIHFFQLMAPPVTTLNKGNLRCMRRPIWFGDWWWSKTFVIKSGISWMMYCGSLLVSQRQTKRDILRAVFLYAALASTNLSQMVSSRTRLSWGEHGPHQPRPSLQHLSRVGPEGESQWCFHNVVKNNAWRTNWEKPLLPCDLFLGVALGLPKFVQAPSDSVTEFKLPQFYVGESYEADGWMILYVCDSCEGGWTQKIKNTYCPIYVLSYVRTYVLTYALKMWTFVVIFLN